MTTAYTRSHSLKACGGIRSCRGCAATPASTTSYEGNLLSWMLQPRPLPLQTVQMYMCSAKIADGNLSHLHSSHRNDAKNRPHLRKTECSSAKKTRRVIKRRRDRKMYVAGQS